VVLVVLRLLLPVQMDAQSVAVAANERPVALATSVEPAISAMAVPNAALRPVRQSIQVEASPDAGAAMGDPAVSVSRAQIETTAGTLDDPARYFQIVPGVQSGSDQRNDFLVRGGNPAENLFVIDGVEVPSINHLALSDTTGGLVSMVDADAVESMTLHAGAHDARFEDRLSSVVEISTMKEGSAAGGDSRPRRIAEAGIAGVGGMFSWRTGAGRAASPEGNGSMLVSVREGILSLLTSNIGLNGVPSYTNILMRGDRTLGGRDKVWGMSLTGVDSIAIRPSVSDPDETNPFDIRYHGWRNTTGMNWQHLWSAKTFGVLTASNAEQAQHVVERDQMLNDAETYMEQSMDGTTTVKYEVTSQARAWLLLSGGGTASMDRVNDVLAQPVPLPSPYSVSLPSSGGQGASAAVTATSVSAAFSTPVAGGFAQGTLMLPGGVRATAATRVTGWGFGGKVRWTPRTFVSVPLGGSRTVSAGYAEYAQMPAYLYRVAFAQNRALEPIEARHLTLDLQNLIRTRSFRMQLAAYDKRYTEYPVASGFPQLSLANIADTFGQSFQLFPMTSQGRGRADGMEASMEYRAGGRVDLQGNVTYARCRYSGLDGVLRPGNFDIPLSAKLAGVFRVSESLTFSARYDGASGRPYTPDNMAESEAQDRDVYDLQRVNGARSRAYGRLDLRFQQTRPFGKGIISWHVGLENALNQKNFYEYVWQPRTGGVSEQDQMPLFPDGGVKYSF